MSFFNRKGKSAEQKAQWAKTRLMLRGAVLVYLVFFIIVPLMNPETEDIDAMNPVTRYVIVAFFIIACGGLLAVTVKDYFQGKKSGLFDPETYEDDEIAKIENELTQEEPQDSDDDDEYDEDEYDEDYGEDEYDDDEDK